MGMMRPATILWGATMLVSGLGGATLAMSRAQAQTAAKPSLTDFQWLAGHWTGQAGGSPLEEFCSTPDHGAMMCMFRATDEQNRVGMEFITLQDKPQGVEERIRFFSPDLGQAESEKATVLRVISATPTEFVLENPNGPFPKGTLTRSGNDEMSVRIEVRDANGKPTRIEAHWKRAMI